MTYRKYSDFMPEDQLDPETGRPWMFWRGKSALLPGDEVVKLGTYVGYRNGIPLFEIPPFGVLPMQLHDVFIKGIVRRVQP